MRGIYIHIPFCRQACRYCDFFFSVSLCYKDEFVDRLVEEIRLRSEEHSGNTIDTLYIGGGTPSILSRENLERIMEAVHRCFSFRSDAEMTIECNPDDMDPAFLEFLKQKGFNRLSVGIQSFHEKDLQLMRRSHDADQAGRCVKDAASAGFENITLDLIYGIPGQSTQEWEENVLKAISLPIAHLSAYHLTFEPGTVFDHWRKKERLVTVHEEQSIRLYHLLREQLISKGFDHYEISNFALHGRMSEHNLIYWSGLPYLGFGPSAHSFDGSSRHWNISFLKGYMEGIAQNREIREYENLSIEEMYHDYLITSLRTRWGADPDHIGRHFGEAIRNHFDGKTEPFLEDGSMWIREGKVAIQPAQWLITDLILRELFTD
ncbi:MAG: radical SAM family heme chaperone HemW [Bacteroidales bacterium]|nr:radical SAM family heme chaperone HemW [Bacteroidales bacterium]